MCSSIPLRVAIMVAATASVVQAQVPQLLNYQGRVRVSGADFTGTGQFKFAMVSSNGATSYWSNDGTSTGGSQPAAAVSLAVQGGLYQILLGDATVPNMAPLPATVFANSGVTLRVWFSDGVNGWQQLTPDQRVAAVGYAMMADNVKDGAISSAKLEDGSVTTAKIGPGAVTATSLAPTAVKDSLNASGQGTVPAGASLLSPVPNAPALLASGYVPSGTINSGDSWTAIAGGTARDRAASVWTGTEMLIWGDGAEGWRYNPATNVWTAMSTEGQPTNRENPLAVWTGSEMLAWGGRISGTYPQTGGKYNPTTNSWTTMSNTNAPVGRFNSTAIWTGGEMIIYGGNNGSSVVGDAARYNPAAGTGGTWTTITAANAPGPRQFHTAVWTGTEMIIHGGNNNVTTFADVARFNPTGGGTWTAGLGASVPRHSHTAVWSGSAMLVWGGTIIGASNAYATGGSYVPSANAWTDLGIAGAPEGRIQHSAVWTGSEMLVWGGTTSAVSFAYTASGGRYNPVNSTWNVMSVAEAPAARVNPNLQWTGSELIVWGGSNGSGLNTGGRYRAGQTFYLYQRP